MGVEGGHKGEELAERQAGRMIRSGIRRHKLKPYRAAAKAEKKAIAANAEFAYQKSLRDNPEMAQAAKNPVSRFWQKQKIKRDYAKAARAAGQTAQGAASHRQERLPQPRKPQRAADRPRICRPALERGADRRRRGPAWLLLVMGGLQSCTAMFGGHRWDGLDAILLSLRGQRYAGSRSRLCRAGSKDLQRILTLRKPAPRL